MLNMQISKQHVNPQAFEVCRILNERGFQAYIVGGCVRDLLLGTKPKDWDITTDAKPEKVMEIFPKNIPTGLQHGTVTVCMGEGVENHFEVTTFRIEGEYTDGRHPDEVLFVMNVEQDLARRDLTINAIAYDPVSDILMDPFQGIQDLGAGIIRAVGNANARFQEDGLRIMRVARFAARFGYNVEGETFLAMQSNIDTLKKVSKERIQDELTKTLMSAQPSYGVQLLQKCGALALACPLLVSKPSYQFFISHLDRCNSPELETRLAFMYGNCNLIEEIKLEMINLKFPNKEVKRVYFYGQLLDRFQDLVSKRTALAYKSFMAVVKNHAPDPWEYTFEQFKILLEAMQVGGRELLDKYKDETVFSKKELQLNGDDLIVMGLKPGPQIKSILDACYLEILKHPENNNRSFLLDFAADNA